MSHPVTDETAAQLERENRCWYCQRQVKVALVPIRTCLGTIRLVGKDCAKHWRGKFGNP